MVLMASLLHMEAPEPEIPGRLQAVGAEGGGFSSILHMLKEKDGLKNIQAKAPRPQA